MLMETRWALLVYDKILQLAQVKIMATETGASLAAHTWLSIITLLQVRTMSFDGRTLTCVAIDLQCYDRA